MVMCQMFSSCLMNVDLFISPGNYHLDHNTEYLQICTGLPPDLTVIPTPPLGVATFLSSAELHPNGVLQDSSVAEVLCNLSSVHLVRLEGWC